MEPIERLITEFGGQKVAGTIIVREDGVNKPAARLVDGAWRLSTEFKERLGVAKPAPDPARRRRRTRKTQTEGTNETVDNQ